MEVKLMQYIDEYIKCLSNKDKVGFLKSITNHIESRIDAWEEEIKDGNE